MRMPNVWLGPLVLALAAAPADAQDMTIVPSASDVPAQAPSERVEAAEDERAPAPAARPAEPSSAEPVLHWLGPAREIARAWSASRDTPAMTFGVFPRPTMMGGGELALASLAWPSWVLRLGFAGFVELEWDGPTDGFHYGLAPSSSAGHILWRGSYAYSLALAATDLFEASCTSCRAELAISYRHESQHYTASNFGDHGEDVSDQPYVGDGVVLDVAFSQQSGEWYFAQRLTGMWFLPDRSSYAGGAAVDLYARWMPWSFVHPFLSLYAELVAGGTWQGRHYPDAYRLRALLGVALPSELGDVLVYVSGDVGHRYGIRISFEEATVGLGIRLTIGTAGT